MDQSKVELITIEGRSLAVDFEHGVSVLIELRDLRSEEIVAQMDQELRLYAEAFFGVSFEGNLIRFVLSEQAQWDRIEKWLKDHEIAYKVVSIRRCKL